MKVAVWPMPGIQYGSTGGLRFPVLTWKSWRSDKFVYAHVAKRRNIIQSPRQMVEEEEEEEEDENSEIWLDLLLRQPTVFSSLKQPAWLGTLTVAILQKED